jgi:hypothetical protein
MRLAFADRAIPSRGWLMRARSWFGEWSVSGPFVADAFFNGASSPKAMNLVVGLLAPGAARPSSVIVCVFTAAAWPPPGCDPIDTILKDRVPLPRKA